MAPDHHISWQKSGVVNRKTTFISSDTGDHKRTSDLSVASDLSFTSMESECNATLSRRRSSNADFLKKIKYFENKTDKNLTAQSLATKPVKRRSLKKIIDDVRAQFPEEELSNSNPDVTPRNNTNLQTRTAGKQSIQETRTKESSSSNCANFFSSGNSEYLMKERAMQTRFKVMLKCSFYNNDIVPPDFSSHMTYYIHDWFDYNLSQFESDYQPSDDYDSN